MHGRPKDYYRGVCLLKNGRLVRKGLPGTNTLAYYEQSWVTAVKKFYRIVQDVRIIKLFFFIADEEANSTFCAGSNICMEGKDITVQGPGFTCKYHTMLVMLALDKHSSLLAFWSGTKKNEFYNMIYRCLGYKTFWVVINALLLISCHLIALQQLNVLWL